METIKQYIAYLFHLGIELILLTVLFISTNLFEKKELIVLLLIFNFIDIVTGILAAIKSGKKITSYTFFVGNFIKLFMFMIVLIVGVIILKVTTIDIIGYLILAGTFTEFWSINENIRTMTDGKYTLANLFNGGLNSLKDFIKIIKEIKEKSKDI